MIRSELEDGVRLLTLDRPEVLNAFNVDQFELMAERMVEAQEDPATKVVVLTGAGRAFSAGADLSGRPLSGRWKQTGTGRVSGQLQELDVDVDVAFSDVGGEVTVTAP